MAKTGPRQKDGEYEIDVALGNRIRARRLELGISMTALAEKAQITFQQIQKYENGSNRVSVSRLHALADALEMTPDELVRGLRKSNATRPDNDRTGMLAIGRLLTNMTPKQRQAVLASARAIKGLS